MLKTNSFLALQLLLRPHHPQTCALFLDVYDTRMRHRCIIAAHVSHYTDQLVASFTTMLITTFVV